MRRFPHPGPLTFLALLACAPACASRPSGGDADVDVTRGSSATTPSSTSSALTASITEVTSFGSNPGALKMFVHVPPSLAAGAPMVLVLHGCAQGAADMATTGWSELADQAGFLAVYPEQEIANNPARCFNWAGEYGDPSDLQRGKGENLSIKQMVDQAVTDHGSDPKRVFVVGFSAGGGTAAIMAATYPDVFAGAATLAGLPYDCTTTYAEVSGCMKPGKTKTAADWAALVKAADPGFAGPWPRVSIWQGSADATVAPANRTELVKQWTGVHGIDGASPVTDTVDGQSHAVYKDASGTVLVETYEVAGMDHGVPVAPMAGCGATATYAFDKGICGATHIASFFGISGGATGSGGDGGMSSEGGGGEGGADAGPKPGAGGALSSSSSSGGVAGDGGTASNAAAPGDGSGGASATCAVAGPIGSTSSGSSGGLLVAGALLALAFALARARSLRAKAGMVVGCALATSALGFGSSGCLTSSGVHTADGGAAPDAAGGDNKDGITYRSLDGHPGCSTVGLETRKSSAYVPATIPGYKCAAKAYPLVAEDLKKPIVLLMHGNSSTPADWEKFPADQADALPMLADRLSAQHFRVLAVDMRYDLSDDPKGDNKTENAGQNFDHGWAVPILEHFIDSVMSAFPDRDLSLVAFSVGPTITRDALRRLHRDGKKPYERFKDLVFAAGAHHGVSSFRTLCGTNPTMRGKIACELGDRTSFQPTAFLTPNNGAGGAWETPCSDGDSAYGQKAVCNGHKVTYTTVVMQDVSQGTYQDEFVSEGSAKLAGATNLTVGLTDNDLSNYFYNGLFKNHMGSIRSDAALKIIVKALGGDQ